jgi:ribosomal protein L16 Arg81 hydroxylase
MAMELRFLPRALRVPPRARASLDHEELRRPELAGDIEPPGYLGGHEASKPLFFFAPSGAVTPLHYDVCHNLIAQISGRKRFTLVAPRYGSFLYHPSFRSRFYWASPVDAEAPDLARYPRFARAVAQECVLEPGDMLFLPGGWRHQVRALEEGISLSLFFPHTLRQRLTGKVLGWLGRPGV